MLNKARMAAASYKAGPGRLRRVAEIASRGIVLRRRLPATFGGKPLYVSPDCGLRYWRRDLTKADPVLLQMVDRYVWPGDVVWDVGANIGLFGFAAAHRASRVVLIEADPWLAGLLEKTARFYGNVSVICAAVADYCGVGTLHIAARARASNFLQGKGSTQTGGERRAEEVQVLTLDSLTPPLPDALKIDVECAELAVLRGATRILAEARPRVICEVSGHNADIATALLHDYKLFDGDAGEPVTTATWNTVAIPRAGSERTQTPVYAQEMISCKP
jgi:FkbM family methyltransferase